METIIRKELEPAESRDWDVRAAKTIEQACKMPLGPKRSDALQKAGRLRIAAEMNRWLSTKEVICSETAPVFARHPGRFKVGSRRRLRHPRLDNPIPSHGAVL
jgi:hypothetical protein